MSTEPRTLTDGRIVRVPTGVGDRFKGVDADGDVLVIVDLDVADRWLYALTPCCLASGKGLMDEDSDYGYVGCRSCYQEVDPKFGDVLSNDDIATAVA